MRNSVVFLDLDGTLTDPGPGITGCLRHALIALEREPPTAAVLARFIGPPLRASFAELLGIADGALIERAIALYRERFEPIGLYENRVYPGIPEALSALRDGGWELHVATAKPTIYAERILRHFALDGYLARIGGSELDGRFSDKAELLAHLLADGDIDPRRAVMVGDRLLDIQAARANGVAAIGVAWGYGEIPELENAGAARICRTPVHLPSLVAEVSSSFRSLVEHGA